MKTQNSTRISENQIPAEKEAQPADARNPSRDATKIRTIAGRGKPLMIGAAIGLTQSDVAPVLQGRDLPIREARRKMDGVAIGVPGGDASSIPDHLK